MASSNTKTRTFETQSGPVIADVQSDLTRARAIPFGQANRFAKPGKPTPWTEPRDCTKLGPVSPQIKFRLEFVLGERASDREFSEDCLSLTVITPTDSTPQSKLPVIVWYHGGANIAGGADIDILDTSDLARRGAVLVNVQYRLSIFGCLEVDGLIPPNLHVLDQIQALQWVHDNISNFGGDPELVTIMGQSAGGCAVYNIIMAEGTEHLYQRAILQSAPLGIISRSGKDAKINAERARELLGGTPESAASKTTAEMTEILETLIDEQRARGGGLGFWASWGKHPLPEPSQIPSRIAELAPKKDLFLGWTADDSLPFIQLSGGLPSRIASIPLIGGYALNTISKYVTNFVFKQPTLDFHAQWQKHGGKSTAFRFDWFPAGSALRACHCIDLVFLFADWSVWSRAPLAQGPGSQAIVERLAPHVKDTFVHFAKSGLPTGELIVIDERFSSKLWVSGKD
jgi:para-nitrobenzyl esterase